MLSGITLQMQDLGMTFASQNNWIRSAAHSYNYLQTLGFARESWPSMEKVIDTCTSSIFLGSRPYDINGLINSVWRSYGLTAGCLANRTRHGLMPEIKRTQKCVFILPPILRRYRDYMDGQAHFRSQDIIQVLGHNEVAISLRAIKSNQPFELLPQVISREEKHLVLNYCAIVLEAYTILKDLNIIMKKENVRQNVLGTSRVRAHSEIASDLALYMTWMDPHPGTRAVVVMKVLGVKMDHAEKLAVEEVRLVAEASKPEPEHVERTRIEAIDPHAGHSLYETSAGICAHWGLCAKEWSDDVMEKYLARMARTFESKDDTLVDAGRRMKEKGPQFPPRQGQVAQALKNLALHDTIPSTKKGKGKSQKKLQRR